MYVLYTYLRTDSNFAFYSINRLVLCNRGEIGYCAVRTESLQITFRLETVKCLLYSYVKICEIAFLMINKIH